MRYFARHSRVFFFFGGGGELLVAKRIRPLNNLLPLYYHNPATVLPLADKIFDLQGADLTRLRILH